MPVTDPDNDIPSETDDSGVSEGALKAALVGLFGSTAVALLTNPREFIETVIFDSVIRPIVTLIVDAFGLVAEAMLILAFGPDKTAFDLSTLGILDIPFYITDFIITALSPIGAQIIDTIGMFNQTIATIGANTGPLAPAIIPFLWMVEVAFVMGLLWWAFTTIDLPFINQGKLISGLYAPLRWVLKGVGLR